MKTLHVRIRRLAATLCVTAVSLTLLAPAAFAAAAGDGDHRVAIADTPRERLGLLLLGAMVIGGGYALVNARRQLKGERSQATGEFRWR